MALDLGHASTAPVHHTLRKVLICELVRCLQQRLSKPQCSTSSTEWVSRLQTSGLLGLGIYGGSAFMFRKDARRFARNSNDLNLFCAMSPWTELQGGEAISEISDLIESIATLELQAEFAGLCRKDLCRHFGHQLQKKILKILRVFTPQEVDRIADDPDRFHLTSREQSLLTEHRDDLMECSLRVSVTNIHPPVDLTDDANTPIDPRPGEFRGIVFQTYEEVVARKLGKMNIVPRKMKPTDLIDLHALLDITGLLNAPGKARGVFHRKFYVEGSAHRFLLRERFAQLRPLTNDPTVWFRSKPPRTFDDCEAAISYYQEIIPELYSENRLTRTFTRSEIRNMVQNVSRFADAILGMPPFSEC